MKSPILALAILATALAAAPVWSQPWPVPPPPWAGHDPERGGAPHPGAHRGMRLAHWYASESTRQTEAARAMHCGFAGSRWSLDYDQHYRWAIRTHPRRVYREVDERDRHLARCRRNKLHHYRNSQPPRRRWP